MKIKNIILCLSIVAVLLIIILMYVLSYFSIREAYISSMLIENVDVSDGILNFSGYTGNSALAVVGYKMESMDNEMTIRILYSMYLPKEGSRKIGANFFDINKKKTTIIKYVSKEDIETTEPNFFYVKEEVPDTIRYIYLSDKKTKELLWSRE